MRGKSIDWFASAVAAVGIGACGAVLALIAVVLWLSLRGDGSGGGGSFYTLANYLNAFGNPFVYRIFLNTISYSVIALAVALGVGVPMAWLVERTDISGKSVIFTLMTISLLIPGFSVALGWLFLLHPRIGIINRVLVSAFSLSRSPLNISTIAGMASIEGLSLVSVAFIMMSAALKAMDPTLEEAASIAGATNWRIISRVTLPVLLPTLLGTCIYIFMIGFSSFDVAAIIGLPNRLFIFATYIYDELNPNVGRPRYGSVAALGMIVVVVAALLSWSYNRLQRQALRFAVVTGKAYRPRVIALGRARAPAIGLIVCYFVAAQALPLAVLVWAAGFPYLQAPSAATLAQYSLANFEAIPISLVARAVGNTLLLMGLVPTITLVLSLAISWVILRTRIRGRRFLDFLAFLPQAIPGIVFSVAALLLSLFVLSKVVPVYGTVSLLIAVYTISRLGYGTRMTNGGLIQIHRELEESAQVGGATTFSVMKSILVPLLAPTLLYSWIWIALLAYRELTLPVLLSTTSNQPLSMVIWGYILVSNYGQASVLVLLMLALLCPVLFLYWIVARRVGIVSL